ncbi:MAG: L-histidine N(alpha)-methyltransferase [Alphaproteobacteria bacterium]|nr:L-histidine N(alpha)-methyltransferase [Alphaproteobacteria bacterium]
MNALRQAMLQEVLQGLSDHPRHLPPKLFYDALGSRLFDAITLTPEYYPTRCELEILRAQAPGLAARLSGALLVELGAGTATKVGLLLDQARDLAGYVPIDIDGHTLDLAARALRRRHPWLDVRPVVADLTEGLDLPDREGDGPLVVFYPGSSIGNFDRDDACALLAGVGEGLRPGDGLLIGFDLDKDPEVLERAYDDAAGVTAAFNRNLLARLNRELGADFDVASFAHEAAYDRAQGRIDMHLRATRAHTVRIDGHRFSLAEGDRIHTESSWKYTRASFAALAADAGWREEQVWTDRRGWFAVGWYGRA